jgi:hypothetical protein
MLNTAFKDEVTRHLPRVATPAQYLGGEVNSIRKDHRHVRGKLCLAFPDSYGIGMSHHGLQVLYSLMNADSQWACERVFAPWPDFEAVLRTKKLPAYGLESFTPLREYDLVGFSLQYEVGYTNVSSSPAARGRRTRNSSPRSSISSSSATARSHSRGSWTNG